jgi:hypothetical protein
MPPLSAASFNVTSSCSTIQPVDLVIIAQSVAHSLAHSGSLYWTGQLDDRLSAQGLDIAASVQGGDTPVRSTQS